LFDLGGDLIGQLHGWDNPGADKLSDFNRRKSRIGQPVNQFNPEINRDEMFKTFQPIAGSEINDFYFTRECHMSRSLEENTIAIGSARLIKLARRMQAVCATQEEGE
jgi:hypothetical protein